MVEKSDKTWSRAVNPPLRCDCRAAVVRAYDGMLASGVSNEQARKVALRVYLHHHPEHTQEIAHTTIDPWLRRGFVH